MMDKIVLNSLKTKTKEVESDEESRVSTLSETSSAPRSSTKGVGRKKSRGRASTNRQVKSLYRFNCFVTEENSKPVFAVQFNNFLKDRNIFATASGFRISIFECVERQVIDDAVEEDEVEEEFCAIKLLRAYDDPDRDEVFYTLAWSLDNNSPIIACGGLRSVVRIIYINGPGLREQKFIGHTNAINEMKFHPVQQHLLLTASKDHSMRLWNIKTEHCVAIFGGVSGHRDEVLAIDFDTYGRHIVSGGMDHNLKVWTINTEELQDAIDMSSTYSGARSFPTLHIHFPDFTTRSIHRNYVDSVKWFGDTFLSKSCENFISWWKPGNLNENGLNLGSTNSTQIHTLDVEDCDMWFVRMDLDTSQRYLAVGNTLGKIFVFDLESDTPNIKPSIITHSKCTKVIRQVSFSRNGNILVASCDDGKIFRFDRNN